jgi:two-component system cell cycle sensor histidine kinase/response regulator CckA
MEVPEKMCLKLFPQKNITETQEADKPIIRPDLILEINNQGMILKKIAPSEGISSYFTNFIPGMYFNSLLSNGAKQFEYYLQKFNQTTEIQRFKLMLFGFLYEIRLNPYIDERIILIASELNPDKAMNYNAEHVFNEKKNLEITLSSIADGIIATDINGKIVYMNNAAIEITGWKLEEALGESLSTVYRTSNHEETNFNKGFDFWEYTFLFTKDGNQRVITDNGASIHDHNGNITGVVVVFRDITEKWRMEEEIERTQRLEFIGNLAGGIAHDFNNILSVVLANIQLVKMSLDKGKDVHKYLNGMEAAVNKASTLTKQLLTFAKGGAPIKKPTLLRDLLVESVELGIKGTNLHCNFLIHDQLWPVEIDPGQISQVFNNLTNNAVRTLAGEGVIEVSARNVLVTNQDVLPLSRGKYIQIIFKDNGPGYSMEKLKRIFDPYYLFGQEGSDLGLAVSYSIIKRHNGFINVQSEPGGGACFTIYLPTTKNYIIPESIPMTEEKGKKVLLMDDEIHITELIGEMLKEKNFQVETAKNGTEVLELYKNAQQTGQPFDLVIMDLTVPGEMGGREAISHLRKIDPAVKAIVSSGYSNDPVMSDCKSFGFCGMVSKPYKIEELCQEINRVLSLNSVG